MKITPCHPKLNVCYILIIFHSFVLGIYATSKNSRTCDSAFGQFLFVLFFADATNFLMQFAERGFAVIMKLSPAFKVKVGTDASKGRHQTQ